MGEFDSIHDTAFQLKTEGEKITLTMNRGVPTTNQATLEWNIPVPALGCEGNGVYAGMLILLHTQPLEAQHIPRNGIMYVDDPTANTDIHAGDKINDALVVGAFYECEKKGQGLPLTTELVITDLDPKQAYYVAGYALDCQNRYHSDGIRSYSDSYGNKDDMHHQAVQQIQLKNKNNPDTTQDVSNQCIQPTDATGLLPGAIYQFDIVLDNTYPIGNEHRVVELDIDGINAGTYQDLVNEMNRFIALVDNPQASPNPPNTGQFFWNASDQTLWQFNGTELISVPVLVESTDPAIVNVGDYWYDPDTKVLSRWNIPSPTGWNVINYTTSSYDPTNPSCNSYWIDDPISRRWNGVVWCDVPTSIQSTDPDDCNIPPCGSWWYDETELVLNEWNVSLAVWEHRTALYWTDPPNMLPDGTYWFDTTNLILNQITSLVWANINNLPNVFLQEDAPIGPVLGYVWYKPSTEELFTYDGTDWIDTPVIVWPVDPADIESCDAWWRSTDDELLLWDAVANDWVVVVNFTVSMNDPVFPNALVVGHVWYDPATNIAQVWDGSAWIAITEFIVSTTDPLIQVTGDGWFDTINNKWFIWDVPATGWNEIDPKEVVGDPALISTGTYWFDTSDDTLHIRNGLIWMDVMYSSTSLLPTRGDEWYNTVAATLMVWDGLEWVPATVLATTIFGTCGIDIVSTQRGSSTLVMVPIMNNPSCTGNGFADFTVDGAAPNPRCGYFVPGAGEETANSKQYPIRHLTRQSYLWNNVNSDFLIGLPVIGQDGVSGTASYDTIGVGDDGTPDERRELMHSIRAQLGYPVVEVELTTYQLDTAIQGALESFRKRSSMAYRRGFYFLDIEPQQQNYILTNKQIGYDKIVSVTAAYRFTSAFLATAHGGGVYGQVVLQHLYNMGTYDLTSYHLVSQYVEQLQDLFSTRLVYNFNEQTRSLGFFQSFTSPERVLLDCSIERTEQDLMTDRYAKTWIERYALAEAMITLARIRGKYGSLPGAGGGVSLDASDLMATAESYRIDLMAQLDEMIVQDMEGLGQHSTFIFGG